MITRFFFLCILPIGVARGVDAQQHVVFTTRTHPDCPVLMSSISQTKEAGFQSVSFRNDSGKSIDVLNLEVSFTSGSGEEVVERASFFATLAPGQTKRLEVYLGKVLELNERA